MKLYKSSIEIICGEYGFMNFHLIVAKISKKQKKLPKDILKKKTAFIPEKLIIN